MSSFRDATERWTMDNWSPFGIPTLYKGIRMRSRLEARWAAMFDALKWPWEYESRDLAGYIPDFILHMGGREVLAEVKGEGMLGALRAHVPKIVASGWRSEFLVLGSRIFDGGVIGIMGDDHAMYLGEIEIDNGVAFHCISCGEMSLRSESLSWRCRLCGARDGNAHVGEVAGGLLDAWAEAGNRVQWRPGT